MRKRRPRVAALFTCDLGAEGRAILHQRRLGENRRLRVLFQERKRIARGAVEELGCRMNNEPLFQCAFCSRWDRQGDFLEVGKAVNGRGRSENPITRPWQFVCGSCKRADQRRAAAYCQRREIDKERAKFFQQE